MTDTERAYHESKISDRRRLIGDRNRETMRDGFAVVALQGILAAHAGEGIPLPKPERAAVQAYEYADAMLAERAKAK